MWTSRGELVSIQQRELGAATILEGSVQRPNAAAGSGLGFSA
jgi:hypothetical protein